MFHVLEVAERGVKLAVSTGKLNFIRDKETSSFPINELDALIIAEPAVSLTGVLLAEMAALRIPVVICDRKYLPVSILLPLIREGSEYHSMLFTQTQIQPQWNEKLWKRILAAKIKGQSRNLIRERNSSALKSASRYLLAGDQDNREGRAASIYWRELNLFPVRDRFADDANIFFNYAYAVLYAAFARNICAAALNPHIGIHHHNQYNPFSLASDLMEPFRPFADRAVFALLKDFPQQYSLTKQIRNILLQNIYSVELKIGTHRKQLPDAVSDSVISYKKALLKQDTRMLLLPEEP